MTNWLVSGMTMLTRSGVEHGRLVVPVRHHVVVGSVVCTARSEHEGVHAHAYVVTLRFDALVDEHARAFLAVDPARFWLIWYAATRGTSITRNCNARAWKLPTCGIMDLSNRKVFLVMRIYKNNVEMYFLIGGGSRKSLQDQY
jgi:hypothetical protein